MTQPLRIAVADDEADTREYLKELLPRLGHEVVAVGSGRELVDLCRASAPDLIITDIRMPDLSGIEAAHAVNREREVPVILITGHHEAEQLARAGIDHVMAYLVKPIDAEQLKATITLAVLRFQHYQALRKEAADLRQALEDRKVIERAKGAVVQRVGVPEAEAFRRLRKHASDHNLKLVEVAKRILAAEEVFHALDQV